MIRRLAVLISLLWILATVPAKASSMDDAWTHALDLSQATAKERIVWMRPDVVLFHTTPHYNLTPSTTECGGKPGTVCARRICGETLVYYAPLPGDLGTLVPASMTLIYLSPNEADLLTDLLTHEFLHSIWWQRVHSVKGFRTQNPDSEAWVQALVTSVCPNL